MRNAIFGGIGVLWGLSILVNRLFDAPAGNGAYGAGQYAAMAFAVLLIIAGTSAVLRARRHP